MAKTVSAIIVAGGNSTRMGLSVSKQLLPLCGRAAISYTLNAFENCADVDEVIVVAKESDLEEIRVIADAFSKVKAVVIGDAERTESVRNGVKACDENAAYFAIHDGARVLITPDEISDVVNAAKTFGAATLATPVTDTIKVVDQHRVITSTPDRSALFAVQTPQVFARELYERALDYFDAHDLSVTDDCSLVEAIGEEVHIVTGSYSNIKLTTQNDILIAEAILRFRGVKE